MKNEITHFALCLNNEGYSASLEVGKLYRVIEDEQASAEGLLRVVDERGEDYAFASNRFTLSSCHPMSKKPFLQMEALP